jgi:predicted metal-dependent phosphoesterase TrpH
MTLVDTLIHIGKLGGMAIAPHPFNQFAVSLSIEAVIGALANPRAKGALKGLETHNTSTKAFNGVAQKLAVHLPLAKIASSDAHNYWGVGAGRIEFPGKTAQDLRKALDQMTIVPVPYEGEFAAKEIFGWGQQLALKRLGYASDSKSETQPINTQRMSESFIQRTKRKK